MGKISFVQGKGSQMHNKREYEKYGKAIPENINQELTSTNIVLVDRDLKKAYEDIFGSALEEYNAKQKRKDRQISSYFEHIQKSKNGEKTFYEDVVQWGSKDDFKDPINKEKATTALVEYVKSFEERNPNLKLIGAYIHLDEASPHLHLDYIPVATDYKRGLKIRNSLDKAMKQMGFEPENENRKNNATLMWKKKERSYLAEICRNLGLEVEKEESTNRKSLSVEEYKNAKEKMINTLEQDNQIIQEAYNRTTDDFKKRAEKLQQDNDQLTQKNEELEKENKKISKLFLDEYNERHNIIVSIYALANKLKMKPICNFIERIINQYPDEEQNEVYNKINEQIQEQEDEDTR